MVPGDGGIVKCTMCCFLVFEKLYHMLSGDGVYQTFVSGYAAMTGASFWAHVRCRNLQAGHAIAALSKVKLGVGTALQRLQQWSQGPRLCKSDSIGFICKRLASYIKLALHSSS